MLKAYLMARTGHLVVLSSKGQIVIPASIRRKLALRTGQSLLVHAEDRRVVFSKVETGSRDVDAMLRRARAWAARSGRDLVQELHDRRQSEREEKSARNAARRR